MIGENQGNDCDKESHGLLKGLPAAVYLLLELGQCFLHCP
jgi:hypothetical protein